MAFPFRQNPATADCGHSPRLLGTAQKQSLGSGLHAETMLGSFWTVPPMPKGPTGCDELAQALQQLALHCPVQVDGPLSALPASTRPTRQLACPDALLLGFTAVQ